MYMYTCIYIGIYSLRDTIAAFGVLSSLSSLPLPLPLSPPPSLPLSLFSPSPSLSLSLSTDYGLADPNGDGTVTLEELQVLQKSSRLPAKEL